MFIKKDYQKSYYLKHKAKINNQRKRWYQKNKIKLKQERDKNLKLTCEQCNITFKNDRDLFNHNKWQHNPETKEKMLKKMQPYFFPKGEKHFLWKGNNAGYGSIHTWIRNRKPKPQFCEICNIKEPCDLANINNHKYDRNPKNYKWSCRRCHLLKDRGKDYGLKRNYKNCLRSKKMALLDNARLIRED